MFLLLFLDIINVCYKWILYLLFFVFLKYKIKINSLILKYFILIFISLKVIINVICSLLLRVELIYLI